MKKNKGKNQHFLAKKSMMVLMTMTMMAAGAMNTFASEKLTCEKDGDVSDQMISLGNAELAKIPDQVRQKLAEDGWRMVVTDKDLATVFYDPNYTALSGITSPSRKTIYVEDTERRIRIASIHETGHAIDYELAGERGYYSSNSELPAIFNEEKSNFVDVTSIGDGNEYLNPIEYFASAWCDYCLANAQLKVQAPKTYAYIEKELCRYVGVEDASYFTYEALSGSIDPEFDANVYYANYPDLRAAIGMDIEGLYRHYVTCGKAEGRNAATIFGKTNMTPLAAKRGPVSE